MDERLVEREYRGAFSGMGKWRIILTTGYRVAAGTPIIK